MYAMNAVIGGYNICYRFCSLRTKFPTCCVSALRRRKRSFAETVSAGFFLMFVLIEYVFHWAFKGLAAMAQRWDEYEIEIY